MMNYPSNPNWLNLMAPTPSPDPSAQQSAVADANSSRYFNNEPLPPMPAPDYSYAPNDLPANMQPGWMDRSPGMNLGRMGTASPVPGENAFGPGPAPGGSAFGGGPGRLGAGQLNPGIRPNIAGQIPQGQPQSPGTIPQVVRPGQDNVDSMGTGFAPQGMPPGYTPNSPQGPQSMPQAPNSQGFSYSNGPDQQGMRKYLTPDQPVGQPQQMPRLQMPVGMPQGQQQPPQGGGMQGNPNAMQQAIAQMSPEEREAMRQQALAQLQGSMSQMRPQPAFTPTSNQRLNINPYGDNNP